jgi:hypothetical protein
MIDKLDTGLPEGATFTRSFSRLVEMSHRPEWHNKVWRAGGHYEKRGDFREITNGELPVILHHINKHDRHAGDKLEIVEAGILSVPQMAAIQEAVFAVPASGNRIMRIDLAADLEGVPVQWFRDHTEFRGKQVCREWSGNQVSSRRAETLTAGQKPNQIRIYDKTGHRMSLTMGNLRRMTRDDRAAVMAGDLKGYALAFEEMWGYPCTRTVTRIERQVGGGGPKRMGLENVEQLGKLAFIDPFTQIVLPEDAAHMRPLKWMKNPLNRIVAEVLSEMAKRDGIVNTWNYLYRQCNSKTTFYRLRNQYREIVLASEQDLVSRKLLHGNFLQTVNQQLRAA